MSCTLDGRRYVNVVINDQITDKQGRIATNPGRVGFVWNTAMSKTHWGQVQTQDDASIKLLFDTRKPVVLKLSRPRPVEDNDYKAFFTLKDEGGKPYRCGFDAE